MENKYLWTGIAITSMWLAVLFIGIYGPTFEVRDVAGSEVTIPTVWGIAFLALIGTIVVGIFGFRK
jgi:hypothetical protein